MKTFQSPRTHPDARSLPEVRREAEERNRAIEAEAAAEAARIAEEYEREMRAAAEAQVRAAPWIPPRILRNVAGSCSVFVVFSSGLHLWG